MTLTTEAIVFYLALVVPLLGGVGFIWAKLDAIWKAISGIRENYVPHSVCEKRRENCPRSREIGNLRERLKEWEDGTR